MTVRYERYILEGTYEIQLVERKKEVFCTHLVATSPLKAMEELRRKFYTEGCNNILFISVYVEIPMMKALEKEQIK